MIGPYRSTFRLDWIAWIASLDRVSAIDMSSINFQLYTFWWGFRSLTVTKKKIGPNFVPWGTAAVIGIQFAVNSLNLTIRSAIR